MFLALGSILFVFSACNATAQLSEKPDWVKLRGFKDDLTMEVPSENLYDKDGDHYLFFAQGQGMWVYMTVLTTNLKALLDGRTLESPADPGCARITPANNPGWVCTSSKQGFLMNITLATSHALYMITIAAESPETKDLRRVLASFKVEDQKVFGVPTPSVSNALSEVVFNSLKSTPDCLDAIGRPQEQIKVVSDSGNDSESAPDSIKYSRPLVILRQPGAVSTRRAMQTLTKSIVKLRVVFEANGQISQITILHAAEPDLTANAIDAAKNIKFLPAKIDNNPVTVSRIFNYRFNIRPWPARWPNWQSQLPK